MAVSQVSMDSTISVDDRPLESHKDDVLGAFMSGMRASQTRRPALEGTLHLTRVPGCLTADELGYVTHQVNELIAESSPDLEELRFVLAHFRPLVGSTNSLFFPQANVAQCARCCFRCEHEGSRT